MGRPTQGKRRLGAAISVAVAIGALAAPAASSAFTVSNVEANPASTQAAANSDLALGFDLADGKLKDLVIHLPPGLVGNPLATPTCSEARLNANNCPPASDVGDISNSLLLNDLIPITASGNVFNVAPRQGEPARFGFVLSAPGGLTEPIILQSPAALRPGDFGLDTILRDVPNTADGFPITITGVDLSLKGRVGSPPKGFLRNPTSCGTNTVTVDVTAYDTSTASGQDTFATTNCGAVPFTPEFSAEVTPAKKLLDGVDVSTTISQTIEEAGLKRAEVILPGDLAGDQKVLLNTCAEADFQAGSCPESSVVGSASASSPLQAQALSGKVMLLESANFLPDLGVDLRGALALKLKGTLGLTPDLRNTATFDNLPDIPIADFTLTFDGGPDGLTDAKRDICEPPPLIFDAAFIAHSGATASRSPKANIDCGDPRATVKLNLPESGQPSLRLKVKAGAANIRNAKLKLPRGLSFADGRKFDRGAAVKADGKKLSGKAVKAGRRSLALKAKKAGVKKFKGKFAGGALIAKKKLDSEKGLKFKLRVKDAVGGATKLTLRAK